MLFVFNLLSANLFLLQGAPRPCTPGILFYRRKVKLRLTTKDSQGTCWFLDLQQKGEFPLRFPRWSTKLPWWIRGSVTALRLLRGRSPQGISKGKPLRYAFADFSRKRKVSASVGGKSPHQQNISFDESLGWGRNQKVLCFTLSRCFSKPLLHGAVHPTKTQTII